MAAIASTIQLAQRSLRTGITSNKFNRFRFLILHKFRGNGINSKCRNHIRDTRICNSRSVRIPSIILEVQPLKTHKLCNKYFKAIIIIHNIIECDLKCYRVHRYQPQPARMQVPNSAISNRDRLDLQYKEGRGVVMHISMHKSIR